MKTYRFTQIAEELAAGRELEFEYNKLNYSITNYDGYWYLYCDTTKTELLKICKFDDKQTLVEKVSNYQINNLVTIKEIFDSALYSQDSLYVL